MKKPFKDPVLPEQRGRDGFTLVELLVAMGVLLLMLVLFTQAVGGISNAWRGAQQRMDNHTKARALLARLQTDIDSMVLRPDLAAFPSAGQEFGFFTLKRGVDQGGSADPDARALSWVKYDYDPAEPGRLLRYDASFSYTAGSGGELEFGPLKEKEMDPDPTQLPERGPEPTTDLLDVGLADGVIGFEWGFLRHDGTVGPNLDYVENGRSRTAKGVVVSLLVMDEKSVESLRQVLGNGAVAQLRNDLDIAPPATADPDWSPKRVWDDKLGLKPGSNATVANAYPAKFVQGVRAFERVYLFPTQTK